MLQTIIKPWWAILLMGILLIICAILIYNNPAVTLIGIAFWLGCVTLLAGVAGIISYFSADHTEKQLAGLLTGIGTLLIGILMISKTLITIRAITIVFGLMMLFIGIWLISFAWRIRPQVSSWWLAGGLGVLVLFVGIESIWSVRAGAEAISKFLGLGIFLSGIGLVTISIVKKRLVNTLTDKWQNLKDNNMGT